MAALKFLVIWFCLYPSELDAYQGWLSSSELPSLELGLQADHSTELPECACDLLWDGLQHLPGSEVVLVGPAWSCSLSLSLPQSQASKMGSNRLLLLICLLSQHEVAHEIAHEVAHHLLLLVGNRALITAGFKGPVTLPKQI